MTLIGRKCILTFHFFSENLACLGNILAFGNKEHSLDISPLFHSWILALVSTFLALFVIGFFVFFVIPSVRLWWELRRIDLTLTTLVNEATKNHQSIDPELVRAKCMTNEPFRHLWAESSEPLHSQSDNLKRATAPAEVFFSKEVLVDIPLHNEFFKHLPGIFTGIGIIGTFSGLIEGLAAFRVTEDHDEARFHLSHLLHSVSDAFMVSAAAIFIAMAVTVIERVTITLRYKQVERLCQLIDSMFTSGVGEEYLARLVKASEESATQTTQLKDSLVTDLKEMMTNLVDRQIEATQNSHRLLAVDFKESITSTLSGPMDRISRVVEQTTQRQGESVQQALSDVIAGFMAKLEETFGGQLKGLNSLMEATTRSMQETRDRFAELVNSLGTASRNAGEVMTEQLTRAMEQAELRQREMNNQMRQFVDQIRESVSHSQTETSNKLNDILETLSHKMTNAIEKLSEQQTAINLEASRQQEAIAGSAKQVMTGLDAQIESLTTKTSEAIQTMKESIAAIRNVTTESIEKMNGAAETLYVAASDFSRAGTGVSGVFDRAAQVADKLSQSATGLDSASRTVQMAVTAYENTRTELMGTIDSLRLIVESAKREAGLSKELIDQLEVNVTRFNTVQRETEQYLENVTNVLTQSFTGFTENITRALKSTNAEFHQNLSQAVTILSNTIQELDGYLAQLPQRR